MALIYDGLLKTITAENVANAAIEYGYVLEMQSLPKNWAMWYEENLIDYPIQREGCMGELYFTQTKMYSIVQREKGEPFFLFLKTKKEKDAVVRDFPDLIVSENPFKTQC